jgi:VWFA-related protein
MIRTIRTLLLFAGLSTLVGQVSQGQSTEPARRPPVLRPSSHTIDLKDGTNVAADETAARSGAASLITIPTIVMDRNGRYVANLRPDDFKIYENGVEQQLSYFASIEKPFTVALMLDVSGSTQSQLAQIRAAGDVFINRLRYNDRLTVITFDGKINLLTNATDVGTVRRSKLRIPATTDGTALYDAVDLALRQMAQIEGRKAIVLMTDGVDESSKSASLQSTLRQLPESDVIIYTVRYDTLPQLPQRLSVIKNEKARRKVQDHLLKEYAVSESYLRSLADKTGGRFYQAKDLGDVAPALAAITAELGVQYSLGYRPKDNLPASGERAIKVRVRYPGLVVRARESYATPQTIASQK